MKRLILMRHAKSSWKDSALSDHERPLNKRGREASPKVARALAQLGWVPEVVISSDSVRTRETWARMEPELEGEILVAWQPELYHGSTADIRGVIEGLPDDVETAMVLGHNPGWESAVERFSGVYARMTTANAALLEGDGAWAALARGDDWRFIEVLRPKEL